MKIILYFKVKIINNQHFLMRMRTKMTGECTRPQSKDNFIISLRPICNMRSNRKKNKDVSRHRVCRLFYKKLYLPVLMNL